MPLTSTISHQLARFVELQPARNTRLRGAEATVAAATTMGVLYLAFGAQASLVGVSGAFIAFTGWDRPVWSRAKILGQLAVVYLAAVSAGVAVAGSGLLSVLVLGVVGLVVTFWYHAVIGDPPGPMLLIAGAGFATWSEALTVNGLPYVLLVIAGMVVSSTVCLLFQLPQRQLPLRQAMDAVTDAVDALVAANPLTTDAKVLARLRDDAFAAHFHAQEMLVDSSARDLPATNRSRLDRGLHALHVQLIEAVVGKVELGDALEVLGGDDRADLGDEAVGDLAHLDDGRARLGGHRALGVTQAGHLGHVNGEVAHALDAGGHAQGRDDDAQVGGHRLLAGEHVDAVEVDLLLQCIEADIRLDDALGQREVGVEQGGGGSRHGGGRQSRHLDQVVGDRVEPFVECVAHCPSCRIVGGG